MSSPIENSDGDGTVVQGTKATALDHLHAHATVTVAPMPAPPPGTPPAAAAVTVAAPVIPADQVFRQIDPREMNGHNRPKLRRRQQFGNNCPSCCEPMSFFFGLCQCRGTILLRSLPQVAMAVAWAVACKLLYDWYPYAIPGVFWTPLYTVTVFLCVFRTNNSFGKYAEGRRLLGKMVDSLTACVRLAASVEGLHRDGNHVDINRIVVLSNVVAAMIRIELRESRLPPGASKRGGYDKQKWKERFRPQNVVSAVHVAKKLGAKARAAITPGGKADSSISGSPLGARTACSSYWATNDDHGAPRISALLSPLEIDMYCQMSPGRRVIVATGELLREFSKNAPDLAISGFEGHLNDATQAWRGCARIIDDTLPFSYSHLLHLMLFVVIMFGTPVAIAANEGVGWTGVPLAFPAAFIMYGLEAMAQEIENPFGWDVNDHDLTRFCASLYNETSTLGNWSVAWQEARTTRVSGRGADSKED